MSEIDYNIFKEWAKHYFKDMIEKNGKIRVHSIFLDDQGGDRKYHLYCKPSIGWYKCMKSGTKGTLYDLVMKLEHCSFDEAVDILEGEQTLRYLEAKLDNYLNSDVKPTKQEYVGRKKRLNFPDNTFLIKSLGEDNHFRIRAENYLKGRKLPTKGLMVCIAGEYGNRIVIPYYDREGDLVYWNARDLSGESPLRYLGPKASLYPDAKKEEVVWMEYFPKIDTKIYLTEGEFDAMTLNECGLHAAAFGGASFNTKQFEMLKGYQIVLAFDADKAGEQGIMQLSVAMMQNGFQFGFNNIRYVRPPKSFKDWNEMLKAFDKDIVRMFIEKKEEEHQILNDWNILKLKSQK
jgi:DNA primase